MSLFDLAGKVAVITGASRGIGRAIALRMAEHGAKVVVSSRKLPACEAVVAAIAAAGGEGLAVRADIARKEDLHGLVEAALGRFGGIDVLVCNAGVNPFFGPAAEVPDEAFERTMNCNVRSNVWLCNRALPEMAARGGGAVIIVSSIAGLRGSTHLGVYALSKAADMQLARNIAVEWGPRNVRANCIAPGLVRTDFARALWENPAILRRRTEETPLQRIGEPDDIAGAAVFLAAAAGAFLTGQTIVIDDGVTAGQPTLPRASDRVSA
jgi:NAD(P)-dependent dehydrogenase (short-subunit alcohol dehydrogenase family)